MRVALCPGTYDPVTCGHLDIIARAAGKFEKLVVAVVKNPPRKTALFSLEERLYFVERSTAHLPNVSVAVLDGLVVDCARRVGADMLVKGLRAVMDFEYEFQMALTNKQLFPDFEVIFLLSEISHTNLSSSLIKDIIRFQGKFESFVPESVIQYLRLHQKEFL